MKKWLSKNVSVGDVAKASGVSRTTVSYVLRNHPGPSQETRERVLQIAKQLNYVPDARVLSFMTRVREAKTKDLLPIAWLNSDWAIEAAWRQYKFLSPFLEGAQERCAELGYRLEEIWTKRPGVTMQQVAQILYRRGIEGVIITYPAKHVRFNWKTIAGVALGGTLLAPQLNRVLADTLYNLQLAIKSVKHLGYRRIGLCFSDNMDMVAEHRLRLMANHLYTTTTNLSDRVRPLFHTNAEVSDAQKAAQFTAWLKREKPAIVIGNHSEMVRWTRNVGYRVPEDIGIVHLSVDDDVLDWAGIYSNRKTQGRTAIELVVSLIQNRQFGIPAVPTHTYIRGVWRMGHTVRVLK